DTGIVEGDAQGGDGGFEVGPSRDLGDDSPELGVLRGARGQSLPQQAAVADQPETGLVAGGLDAADDGRGGRRRIDIGAEQWPAPATFAKCRWQPVERPVLPTLPMTSPASTVARTEVAKSCRW